MSWTDEASKDVEPQSSLDSLTFSWSTTRGERRSQVFVLPALNRDRRLAFQQQEDASVSGRCVGWLDAVIVK